MGNLEEELTLKATDTQQKVNILAKQIAYYEKQDEGKTRIFLTHDTINTAREDGKTDGLVYVDVDASMGEIYNSINRIMRKQVAVNLETEAQVARDAAEKGEPVELIARRRIVAMNADSTIDEEARDKKTVRFRASNKLNNNIWPEGAQAPNPPFHKSHENGLAVSAGSYKELRLHSAASLRAHEKGSQQTAALGR